MGKNKRRLCLGCQVADVQRPLVSVNRICEKGNTVNFGPGEHDNYIQNIETKDKIFLKPNGGGSYLLDVCFEGGGRTQMTVDSGAEESVCPWEWGEQFGISQSGEPMIFRGANGQHIRHYGQREVYVVSPF